MNNIYGMVPAQQLLKIYIKDNKERHLIVLMLKKGYGEMVYILHKMLLTVINIHTNIILMIGQCYYALLP